MTGHDYATLNSQPLNRQAADILSRHKIPWSPAQEIAALALLRQALEKGALETPTIEEPMLLMARLEANPEEAMRLLTESAPGEVYEIDAGPRPGSGGGPAPGGDRGVTASPVGDAAPVATRQHPWSRSLSRSRPMPSAAEKAELTESVFTAYRPQRLTHPGRPRASRPARAERRHGRRRAPGADLQPASSRTRGRRGATLPGPARGRGLCRAGPRRALAQRVAKGLLHRRRHRGRQGPGDLRGDPGQPGPRPRQGRLGVLQPRTDRGRQAGLRRCRRRSGPAVLPGRHQGRRRDHARARHPLHHLQHAARRREAPGHGSGDGGGRSTGPDPAPAAHRLARPGLRRRDRLRRGPQHGQRHRGEGRARGAQAVPAGRRRHQPAEGASRCPRALRLGDRRHRGRQPDLCRAPGSLGRGHALCRRQGLHRPGLVRRHRRDGADGPRPEGPGRLHRPLALL